MSLGSLVKTSRASENCSLKANLPIEVEAKIVAAIQALRPGACAELSLPFFK
jgi:hypothetical protein